MLRLPLATTHDRPRRAHATGLRSPRFTLLLALTLHALATTHLAADDGIALAPSLGVFDVGKGEKAAEAGLELRWRHVWYNLRPMAGVMVTSDEAAYVYAGARYDQAIADRWWLTPSFAVGAYRRGDGKDLGQTLEFRSAIEASYELDARQRIGVTLYHLSNASLSDTNPGSESLIVSWSVRLR